jgi:cell division inhibitor SepF
MNRFFKRTLSFLGLRDEDEIDLDDEEKNESLDTKKRQLKDEDDKSEDKLGKKQEKKIARGEHGMFFKPAKKASFAGSGRDGMRSRVFIAEPKEFEEIQVIADNFKDNIPVIINLQEVGQDLSKRVIDFCSGLTYALEGNIRKVTEKVFLITPYNVEVSSEEEDEILKEEGFYNHF